MPEIKTPPAAAPAPWLNAPPIDPQGAPSTEPPVDPLAELRDIHLPPEVSFWPPAPGWWIVAGLVVLAMLGLAYLEWRRRQTLSYRAVKALEAIGNDHARYPDSRAVAAEAAVLIRRVVLSRPGRGDAAALTGEAWQGYLAKGKAGVPADISAFLAKAPYLPPQAPASAAVDRTALVASLRRWIKANA